MNKRITPYHCILVVSILSAFPIVMGQEVVLHDKYLLRDWQPPVEVSKVFSARKVEDSLVIDQGDRKVRLERCEDEPISLTELLASRDKSNALQADSQQLEGFDSLPAGWESFTTIKASITMYWHEAKIFTRFRVECAGDEVQGWSKVDFNHIRGVGTFSVDSKNYYLVGGFGVQDESIDARLEGCPEEVLSGKVEIVFDDNKDGAAALAMQDLHKLYHGERTYLESQWLQTVRNMELKRQWDLAHPQQAKDITVRFWKRQPKLSQ